MPDRFDLHLGDCLEVMPTLAADSVDSIVTDPPYGLSFMGKGWDHGVPCQSFWAEALRVAKPGAHLLAFGGTRTYHRLACAIEDAGWEIRDCVMWVYGSGFPKSLDVSKAIDKVNGESGRLLKFTQWYRGAGVTRKATTDAMIQAGHISENGTMAGHYFANTEAGQPAIPTRAIWETLRPLCGDVPTWVDALIERIEAEREVVGQQGGNLLAVAPGQDNDRSATTLDITAPATEAARQWQGWGTALKPAYEPIIVARKPLDGTVAANVLKYGTGAINVDGCRIEGVREKTHSDPRKAGNGWNASPSRELPPGRWPANFIHDGSEEVLGLFPAAGGNSTGKGGMAARAYDHDNKIYGKGIADNHRPFDYQDGKGSAARFFYCAKASKADRDEGLEQFAAVHRVNGNKWTDQDYRVTSGERPPSAESGPRRNVHPTVKPTSLMRYLCRLVTPPGGIVLDPFMGSGSTGKGAVLEGFRFIGIEREADYLEIAQARIDAAMKSGNALPLFQEELACV